MLNILNLIKRKYQTLNTIEISSENLIQNYHYLASLSKLKIAPVLKSNAYGHGIVEVAKILDRVGAPFFCVDSLYEAYELYKAKITTPILVIGYTDPQNFKVKKLPFSYALFDLKTAEVLNKYQPGCKIHIFVDTGMNREGIKLEDLPIFLTAMKQFNNLTIDGLMSHLACAESKKDPLNKIQIKNFKKALQICKKYQIHPRWIHFSNSDELLNSTVLTYHTPGVIYPYTVQNMTRVGLALYGISTNPNLKPILALKSKIIQIKNLHKGDRVGYGREFSAQRSMLMGVLPLGYYDGVDRRLSNKGFVIIDQIPYPIIGRISMNITTIDISKVPNPKIGEEVLVYSQYQTDLNSITNSAKICNTIPYDLLVHLAESTKRVVF